MLVSPKASGEKNQPITANATQRMGEPDCEKAELQHIYLMMKINGLKLAH